MLSPTFMVLVFYGSLKSVYSNYILKTVMLGQGLIHLESSLKPDLYQHRTAI